MKSKLITRFLSSDDGSTIGEVSILLEYDLGDKIMINQKEYEVVDNSYMDEITYTSEQKPILGSSAFRQQNEVVTISTIFRRYSVYKIPQ